MIKPIQLIKINRISAWVLLVTILAYFVSGFGMTKGIIDRQFSLLLHESILPFFTITAFILHVSISLRTAFMRWRIWNKITLIFLTATFSGAFLLFLYFQFFMQPNYAANVTQINSSQTGSAINSIQTDTSQTQKIFTLPELAKYNGQNGMPAYVAVSGKVYDLSNVFINGQHFGFLAGQDLTSAFYSRHDPSILSRFPVVGLLK